MLRELLKAGDPRFIRKYAVRVRQQVSVESPLSGIFAAHPALVPVPGSVAAGAGHAPVTLHLAEALLEQGLGRCVWCGLRRVRSVRKSATASPNSRPTVNTHYESFATLPGPPPSLRIVLVDDVVTKGRTLFAAAARVKEAYPEADVCGFAMLRTMGLIAGIDRLLEPCLGEIRWRAGDAHRSP